MDTIDQIISVITDTGLLPPKQIILDNEFHRFPSHPSDNKASGWYIGSDDGGATITFGCNRTGEQHHWRDGNAVPLPDDERKRLAEIALDDRKKKWFATSVMAQHEWDNARRKHGPHPYEKLKRTKIPGCRIADHRGFPCLTLPLKDVDENICSLKYITPDGAKYYLTGAKKPGIYFEIPGKKNTVYLCEGAATGGTIHQLTGCTVVCAMDKGQLNHVAAALLAHNPKIKLVIVADNDTNTEGNPGLTAAIAVAEKCKIPIVVPDKPGDLNDLFVEHGETAALGCLNSAGDNAGGMIAKDFDMTTQIEALKQEMKDFRFLLGKFIGFGQVSVIFAPFNVGKTLLVIHWLLEAHKAGRLDGIECWYCNADDSFQGAITKAEILREAEVHCLTPHILGATIETVTDSIKVAIANGNCADTVLILDTLKKFSDPMSKPEARAFTRLLRAYAVGGGTVLLLAHCNKRRNDNGRPVPEGVGDWENDSDASYILDVVQEPESQGGEKIVQLSKEKVRGPNQWEATFKYRTADPEKPNGYLAMVDSVEEVDGGNAELYRRKKERRQKFEADKPVIEAITEVLKRDGELTQEEILASTDSPRERTRRVLKDYAASEPMEYGLWSEKRGKGSTLKYGLFG